MKTKKKIKIPVDSSQKSDKDRIRELEDENARLKYEIFLYRLYDRNARNR